MSNKFMIRCDMEGASGIVSAEQADPGRPEYRAGREYFMSDLLAAVTGLREGGAGEIVIYDEHFYGRNIDCVRLPAYAAAICGKPPYCPDWPGGIDKSFAGMILLGFHSKAETRGGLLPHTYEPDIKNILLNGVAVGEIGVEAAIAGDSGVPVVLYIGDAHGADEIKKLMSGVLTVSVKKGFPESGAFCYPVAHTRRLIQAAAKQAARRPPPVKPYKLRRPVVLEIVFYQTPYLAALRKLFPADMAGDTALKLKGKSAVEVWARYWQMKLRCQAECAQRKKAL